MKVLGWRWLIKLYRFQVYTSITLHFSSIIFSWELLHWVWKVEMGEIWLLGKGRLWGRCFGPRQLLQYQLIGRSFEYTSGTCRRARGARRTLQSSVVQSIVQSRIVQSRIVQSSLKASNHLECCCFLSSCFLSQNCASWGLRVIPTTLIPRQKCLLTSFIQSVSVSWAPTMCQVQFWKLGTVKEQRVTSGEVCLFIVGKQTIHNKQNT